MNKSELSRTLLQSVSRSFYLSIKVLPRAMRGPVSLAYLLARTSDTIADTASVPASIRLETLRCFGEAVAAGGTQPVIIPADLSPEDPAERDLLRQIPSCLEWLESSDSDDQADIIEVLREIVRGQALDLARFANASQVTGLKNAAELEEYTYLVAGCVGKFWTRLCFRHIPGFSAMDCESMTRWGVSFGKGLQLVNILRDLPADFESGRCYLPMDELGEVDLGNLRSTPEHVRPVLECWLEKAALWLDDGFRYIESVRSWRLRYACILPWYLGMRTLALLSQTSPLEADRRIKVSRNEVRALLGFGLGAAVSNRWLRCLRRFCCSWSQ